MTKEEFDKYYDNLDTYSLYKLLTKIKCDIMNDNSWKLYYNVLNERIPDGIYLTIRAGLGGHIYTIDDEMKDGKWQNGVADGSYVIFYKELTFDMLEDKTKTNN